VGKKKVKCYPKFAPRKGEGLRLEENNFVVFHPTLSLDRLFFNEPEFKQSEEVKHQRWFKPKNGGWSGRRRYQHPKEKNFQNKRGEMSLRQQGQGGGLFFTGEKGHPQKAAKVR